MAVCSNPIVLVHGLWDNPFIFNRLVQRFEQKGVDVFVPHLPHEFGRTSILKLANDLNSYISRQFTDDVTIDLLGFSMGGLIGRVWLQYLNGTKRTERFITVGTPHNGTLTAQLIPSWLFPGIAQMKLGSVLLKELNDNSNSLTSVDCISFYCLYDLMVFPGWRAVLPVGPSFPIAVLTHKGLIKHSHAINVIATDILVGRTN